MPGLLRHSVVKDLILGDLTPWIMFFFPPKVSSSYWELGLNTTQGITQIYLLRTFFQAISKDLNLGNTKLV